MKSGLSWCFSFAMVTLCVVAMIFQPLRLVNYAFKKAFVVNTLLESSTVLNFHSCERSSNEVVNENISMKINKNSNRIFIQGIEYKRQKMLLIIICQNLMGL